MQEVIKQIAAVIEGTEFAGNTYIAGGYVRDLVLGNEKSDLDIAVALPEGGIKLAEFLHEKGLASKPVVFQQFGTALVEINEQKIEFVMTRNESYRRGNRKPLTSPGTLLEDIIRRDFTINSLVMNIITGEILDLTGKGLTDIKEGVIRATSDPDFIFHDDPLRILRAVRFANRLQFQIEEVTSAAMKKDSYELNCISWERRRDEFEKILLSETPELGTKLLYEYNLMQYLIPELQNSVKELPYQEITALPAEIILRIAAVLQVLADQPESEEIISLIIDRLRFSSNIKKRVQFLVINNYQLSLLIEAKGKNLQIRKLVYYHPRWISEFVLYYSEFAKSRNWQYQPEKLVAEINNFKSEIVHRKFPLDGNLIKQEFEIPEGEEIGRIKKKGLERWLLNPDLTAEDLLLLLNQQD